MGAQHCPFGLHALRGAACRGGGRRLSRGGWPSTVVRGVWCQALSLPRPAVPWGGSQGSATRVSQARLVWPLGPSTGPTVCALASCCCALWGRREGVPGGGSPRHCEGAPGVRRARPPPAARPWGGQLGPVAHLLCARVRGYGCAARPWGWPGLGACGVFGACAVFV